MEEQYTKHVTYKIAYHFVWCPKCRKHVLVGEVAQFIEAEIRRLCEENHWKIGALSVQEDHVHLFLRQVHGRRGLGNLCEHLYCQGSMGRTDDHQSGPQVHLARLLAVWASAQEGFVRTLA